VSLDLARTLVLTEAVPWASVAQALFVSAMRDVPFVRALLDTEAITLERLEQELARAGAPACDAVTVDPSLADGLPRGLCGRLFGVPLRKDAGGTVDVALADARDAHAAREFSHHLRAPVRVLRAPFAKIEEAVSRLPGARKEEAFVESTLVSVRAPDGIPRDPASERTSVPAKAPSTAASSEGTGASVAPASASPSGAPLPLVVRATEQPILPLVRRAEEQPVIELRSPYSRHPGRAFIESAAVAAMRSAHTRDEILRLLLEGTSEYAKRVVLFAVRKDAFTGLLCTPTMGDEARIREVRVPAEGASIFANVASGGTYLGALYHAEAHKPLLALLPRVADTVAVTAVRLRGRPLVIMLVEGMTNAVQDVRLIEELARAAGEAFARVLAAKPE
jgi:hypothetical protein